MKEKVNMNLAEMRAVRRNFAKLVKEVKAMDMLDDLFASEVIDMDDYQRVTGQLADSDKIRKLLEAILTKKDASVNIFHGFVKALENINRPDLAEDLLQSYQSEISTLQTLIPDLNSVRNESATSSNLTPLTTGEFVFQSSLGSEAGLDVADAAASNIVHRPVVNSDNSARLLQPELSAPVLASGGGIKLSEKELREAAKSAKGKTGNMIVAGRILEYEMRGIIDPALSELVWKIRLVDHVTQKFVETSCEGDRFEEMYNCLVKLLADL